VVVPEVIAIYLALREAVAQVPGVEVEYRYEGEPAEAELNLAADPALREICESDLRPIPAAPVESVEVLAALVTPSFRLVRFCSLCSLLSTAAEIKLRPQSAGEKVDYRG
jgi:hypothetical protein